MATFDDFSKALENFHRENQKINNIQELYDEASEYFLRKLKEVDVEHFNIRTLRGSTAAKKKSELIYWIDELINNVLNIQIKEESDNILTAPKFFYDAMFNSDGTPKFKGMTCAVSKNENFFRVRKAEKYELYDRNGMFILSDDKENLVGDYRFNPSGYACLYLASNLYLAWEETRRPDFDTVNFSMFKSRKNLLVLDLTIKRRFREYGDFLMGYLTLLCCAKTNDKDSHKYQYVVPHMLMKVLCLSQSFSKKSKNQTIDGIRYLSSRRYDQKDFLFSEPKLSIAYVFPQRPHSAKEMLCPFLRNTFVLTEPRSYFLYKSHRMKIGAKPVFATDYDTSLFKKLESLISLDKLDKVN